MCFATFVNISGEESLSTPNFTSCIRRELQEESLTKIRVSQCMSDLEPLATISINDRAIDGFLKIIECKCNACAVVDHNGRLVASLSASDLRGMTNAKLRCIFLPVMEFFPAMTGSRAPAPLVCSPEDRLVDTMKKIVKASIRRCWLVDHNFVPLGLISMGKIIVCALTNACKHL